MEHEVRVVDVPPAVEEPGGHTLQLLAPLLLNLSSEPQAVRTLLPSHEWKPAGHAEHDVRVVDVPPEVEEPAGHVLQLLAPAALNLSSAPHGTWTLLPSHS